MAYRFRCTNCGKRMTVNEPPGADVACPHCNHAVVVPEDAQEIQMEGGYAAGPEPVASGQAAAEEAEEEQEEEEEESGMDTVMGWLALYLPSWGTSLVLHAAAFILAFFMVWQQQTVQPEFKYKSAVVQDKKHEVKKRERTTRPSESRGRMKPQPTSIVRAPTDNPVPDVASHNMERVNVIGVGGGGNVLGGWEGLGDGRGGFFGAGREEVARKIVYVVDRSGSMTDSIMYVKYELKRSIGELGEDAEFHVIFFSSGPPVEMPTRRLVPATERNKQLAFEFIDSIVAQGETDPSKALDRAFAVDPELIYLLTDGEFDKAIIGRVNRLNEGQKVTVHTIAFMYRAGEKVLKQIAKENNGDYKFVSEADLATLGE